MDIALERDEDLAEHYFDLKREKYINASMKITHAKALAESDLTEDEFESFREELTESITESRLFTVLKVISKGNTTTRAAKKAGVSVKTIYDWYYQGSAGDENYSDFAEVFEEMYIKPRITDLISDEDVIEISEYVGDSPINFLVNTNRITKQDAKFWKQYQTRVAEGLI